jgi:hypothetical protein
VHLGAPWGDCSKFSSRRDQSQVLFCHDKSAPPHDHCELAAIDAWCRAEDDKPSRTVAIRRLVEQAIAQSSHGARPSKQKAQKASERAARTADHLVDKSMPVEEQERRKRAVIKGPKEFRDICEDLPKRADIWDWYWQKHSSCCC